MMRRRPQLTGRLILWVAVAWCLSPLAIAEAIVAETPEAAAERHRRVVERRKGIQIICHRGAWEFAHENTLEAYRASFELGADGNEIDIRATRDGVLVCFHDDMLDHLLEAYGDVSDHKWEELRRFRFRSPGPFGAQCRIPTLEEVFDLHRRYAGLMHLDIKRPEVIADVMQLVDRMDMWDHVVHAPAAFADSRVRLGQYKTELYSAHGEVDERAIAEALKMPGDSVIVDDPRGVAVALGRTLRRPSSKPVAPLPPQPAFDRRLPSAQKALEILREAQDWNQPATGRDAEAESAQRILRRATAADAIAELGINSPEALSLLRRRVVERSLHRDWRYHGLDGAAALRALIRLQDSHCHDLARMCLWRDDPAVETVANPQWHNPRAWTDLRTKIIVFPLMANIPGEDTERLCRDYLALSDEAAARIGIPNFEAAAATLLDLRRDEATAGELMTHRRGDVRGRAILLCLKSADEPWAKRALTRTAPHALAYIIPPITKTTDN